MHTLYVGIDVSKEASSAQGIDSQGEKIFYLCFDMDAKGFSDLLGSITSQCKDLSKVTIAMESTGCYHMNLYAFLVSKGIKTVVINPLLISNFTKLSLRKTKTDKKDALTIAKFLVAHKDSLSKISSSQNTQDLKDLARERESLSVLISGIKNDIKRILQGTFPELESICNPFTQTMLNFLLKFPSARLIQAASTKAIAKALLHSDQRKRVSVSPKVIVSAAKKSVASVNAAKELILPEKVSTLLYLIEKQNKITELLIGFCEETAIDDLQIITSIKGISEQTAATFLAETGNIRNFPSAKGVIAYAGMDPTIHQSGKFEGKSKISKRGNRHLRRIIFLMGKHVSREDTFFKTYYEKRRGDGLSFKEAVLATAHKLIRVIFAMLKNRSYFSIQTI